MRCSDWPELYMDLCSFNIAISGREQRHSNTLLLSIHLKGQWLGICLFIYMNICYTVTFIARSHSCPKVVRSHRSLFLLSI